MLRCSCKSWRYLYSAPPFFHLNRCVQLISNTFYSFCRQPVQPLVPARSLAYPYIIAPPPPPPPLYQLCFAYVCNTEPHRGDATRLASGSLRRVRSHAVRITPTNYWETPSAPGAFGGRSRWSGVDRSCGFGREVVVGWRGGGERR